MTKLTSRLGIGISTAATLLLTGCGNDAETPVEVIPRVKYFVVGEQATGQSRRISGKVVAADISPLSFSVSGTVEEVLVSQGDTVRQGQVFARLDSEPLRLSVEQARAQLNIARAQFTETKQVYDRVLELRERDVASRAELDTATNNHTTARGNLRVAQSDLERRERDLNNSELVAPFSGTIASRSIEPFQEINLGQEAFVLQVADALEVEVRVPETLIRNVDYGQAVIVSFPSMANTSVNGVVNEIGSRVETGNSFPVSVRLSATDADLRPGMTASVTFNFDEYLEGKTVYLIPLSAIAVDTRQIRPDSNSVPEENRANAPVYVITESGELELRLIEVGGLRGNQVEVYDGLEAGEKIVSAGVALLREGMTVELWSPEQV